MSESLPLQSTNTITIRRTAFRTRSKIHHTELFTSRPGSCRAGSHHPMRELAVKPRPHESLNGERKPAERKGKVWQCAHKLVQRSLENKQWCLIEDRVLIFVYFCSYLENLRSTLSAQIELHRRRLGRVLHSDSLVTGNLQFLF